MVEAPKSYTVVFASAVEDVPIEVREHLRGLLDEIGATLDSIPTDSTFWHSIRTTPVILDVRGWRFFYRVEQLPRRIVVTERRFGAPNS